VGTAQRNDPEGLHRVALRFGGVRQRVARASSSLRCRSRAVRGEVIRRHLSLGRGDTSPHLRVRRQPASEPRFLVRYRMTLSSSNPVNSGRVSSSLFTTPEIPEPTPSGDGSGAGCAARPLDSTVFLPRALHHRLETARDNVDSSLRIYSVVASKDTGDRTRRCLQPHVHPVDRKTSRPTPRLNPGNKRRRGRTNPYGPTVVRRLRSPDEPHERNRAHWRQ
jgi:hypothetical protein